MNKIRGVIQYHVLQGDISIAVGYLGDEMPEMNWIICIEIFMCLGVLIYTMTSRQFKAKFRKVSGQIGMIDGLDKKKS
ncbi:MAG: hypothetical protein ACRDDX_05425 [Cellulosilyticaceae bacterium]